MLEPKHKGGEDSEDVLSRALSIHIIQFKVEDHIVFWVNTHNLTSEFTHLTNATSDEQNFNFS